MSFICRILPALLLLLVLALPAHAAIDKELYSLLDQYAQEIERGRHDAVTATDRGQLTASSRTEEAKRVELEGWVTRMDHPDDIRMFFSTVNVFVQTRRGAPFALAAARAAGMLEEKSRSLLAQGGDPATYEQVRDELGRLKDLNQTAATSHSTVAQFAREDNAASTSKAGRSSGTSSLPAGMLGAKVTASGTSFQVFSPRATAVNLMLYNKPTDKQGKRFSMKKQANGIWRATFKENLTGKWYLYQADGPKGPGERFDPKKLISDPYSICNANSAGMSLVYDDNYTFKSTFRRPAMEDLIIYEMHVKDYTAHASSGVAAGHKGKYLGLLSGASSDKVLGNLVDLGVNAVELLPVQEFDNRAAPSGVNHWGYMTTHFFAPEASFASGYAGQQVLELKKLVDGLHSKGIAVIMDVVYNHTAEGNEQGPNYCFKGLDNHAYYRLYKNPDLYWNGTGCGNEFRSDHPATRKLIIDSLLHFVKEYKIDGFRFDLATIIDKQTMSEIEKAMPAGVYLIAEPWAADWSRNQWAKTDFRNTRWAKWNDDYKGNIRKFIRGEADRNNVMTVLAGSCYWWAGKPTETINFIECHDNATIMDFLGGWAKGARFGMAVLLTSQGVPMLHEGMEFLKTKFGNDNSYDQDNKTNWIDWSLKTKNKDTFNYIKELIAIRKAYPHFRHNRPLTDKEITWMLHSNQKALGARLAGTSCDLLVLYNSDPKNWADFALPESKPWTILSNGEQANTTGKLGTAAGNYKVPPTTVVILRLNH